MPELFVARHTVWCCPDPRVRSAVRAVRHCDTTRRAFRERAKLLRLAERCWCCQQPFNRHRKGRPPAAAQEIP